ncbi:unnamed protein product [Bacillus phage SPP1]|uniref:Bacteriophage SPP1 complete nucleotide sequence n=1 Tax=Bacillus phage SPP1 TaxID=10724 RepID=O48485_BPSPP|nr:hypothetical protein SPP1p065 [Bacillus phage SPP1]CAA66532.1 unnamed protein product [Bacillus phage SPP1]
MSGLVTGMYTGIFSPLISDSPRYMPLSSLMTAGISTSTCFLTLNVSAYLRCKSFGGIIIASLFISSVLIKLTFPSVFVRALTESVFISFNISSRRFLNRTLTPCNSFDSDKSVKLNANDSAIVSRVNLFFE